MDKAESQTFIDTLADLMSHSSRMPILRRPDEYGMKYADVFFPSSE